MPYFDKEEDFTWHIGLKSSKNWKFFPGFSMHKTHLFALLPLTGLDLEPASQQGGDRMVLHPNSYLI